MLPSGLCAGHQGHPVWSVEPNSANPSEKALKEGTSGTGTGDLCPGQGEWGGRAMDSATGSRTLRRAAVAEGRHAQPPEEGVFPGRPMWTEGIPEPDAP